METLFPSLYYMSNSDWLNSSTSSEWTREENKKFERALAIYDDEQEPERWRKVAALIPGKSIYDVLKHYRELEDDVSDIEAGKIPIPGYNNNNNYYYSSDFIFDWSENRDFDECRKKSLGGKNGDQERKKGVPWTEDEHRRFLLGLLKHGKGDWRNISRNFVISKTPTQVASHAQKYFIRQQISGVKDKRRPSIHDITTFNLSHTKFSDHNKPGSLDRSDALLWQRNSSSMQKMMDCLNYSKNDSVMLFDCADTNFLEPSSNQIGSANMILQRYRVLG
ncbi:transcription factor DIVARICATA-like [Mercurialis annua]|uniref:transcription factor DIVARICATA-like n=1 Tax=Mercurialis annua TaxID=3986 RepID=UPI0021604DB7|nr:transcription factor DIVARICATA-like [Mercurialis annua]